LRDSLGRVDHSLTIGLVALAALGACAGVWPGLVILFRAPVDERGVGLNFLIAGILCAMALPVVLRWRRQKARDASEALVKADFEHLVKEKQRIFEADEAGWILRSEFGNDSRAWSLVTGLWDGERILTLHSQGSVYVLPSRSLTKEQKSELQNWVSNAMRASVADPVLKATLHPTALDFTVGAGSQLWQYQPTGLILLGGMIVASAGMLWDQIAHSGEPGSDQSGLILAIVLLVSGLWFMLAPLQKYGECKRQAELASNMEASFSSDALYLEGASYKSLLPFGQFRKFKESSRTFLLYYNEKQFVMLPKRGLSREQVIEVRNLLSARIARV
jgi:YcxB-like protein